MFYDTFFELCSQKGVTPNKACVDCEISRTSVAKWKKGSTPNGATLTKLAEYFEVSTDYLLGNEQKEKPAADSSELNERDKKDIAKSLEVIMSDLENSGDLMFDGDPASPEAIESIRNAMAMALEYAKKVNKQKYTPKKYRK